MRIPIIILLSLIASVSYAKDEIGFAFAQSARLAPQSFEGLKVGPFGITFIAQPKWRFFPQASIPKVLAKEKKDGHVRAALRIGKDGHVKEVKILEALPEGEVEKEALGFSQRAVYHPDKVGEFETDVVLLFRKASHKKKA